MEFWKSRYISAAISSKIQVWKKLFFSFPVLHSAGCQSYIKPPVWICCQHSRKKKKTSQADFGKCPQNTHQHFVMLVQSWIEKPDEMEVP